MVPAAGKKEINWSHPGCKRGKGQHDLSHPCENARHLVMSSVKTISFPWKTVLSGFLEDNFCPS